MEWFLLLAAISAIITSGVFIILFFIALISLTVAWFNIFLADIFPLRKQPTSLLVCAVMSLLCYLGIGFFAWVFIESKDDQISTGNTVHLIAKVMLIISFLAMLLFTAEYNNINYQIASEKLLQQYEN